MNHVADHSFFFSPPGQLVREWESSRLDQMVSLVLGERALQIGLPYIDTLRANGMQEHWLLEGEQRENDALLRNDLRRVIGIPEELPFAEETFDLVVLPHSLDFSDEPQYILAEAVRVLAPEGRLIVTGINPLGLWWWRQQGIRFGRQPYLPSETNPIAVPRLKDWFSLLGLQVNEGSFGVYRPARRSRAALNRWKWLEKAGDRWFPQCGNIYLLSATKKLPGRIPRESNPITDTLNALAGKTGQQTVARPMSSKIDSQV